MLWNFYFQLILDCICLCQKIKGFIRAVICYFLLREGKGVICRKGPSNIPFNLGETIEGGNPNEELLQLLHCEAYVSGCFIKFV